eukprot:EG_transcript_25888
MRIFFLKNLVALAKLGQDATLRLKTPLSPTNAGMSLCCLWVHPSLSECNAWACELMVSRHHRHSRAIHSCRGLARDACQEPSLIPSHPTLLAALGLEMEL